MFNITRLQLDRQVATDIIFHSDYLSMLEVLFWKMMFLGFCGLKLLIQLLTYYTSFQFVQT
jgi:hypothetical protein